MDDSRRFGGRSPICPAIDPVFLGQVYHLLSRDDRNGHRNPTSVTVERPNHFDHPVRQGRQRRPQQLQPELGRLHGLGRRQRHLQQIVFVEKQLSKPQRNLDTRGPRHLERVRNRP